MTTWPSTLPQSFDSNSFEEGLPDNRLEHDMEYGPPKRRRRTTANVYPLSGTMLLDDTQWAALKTFFKTTVAEVEAFDFPNPDGGSAISVVFAQAPKRKYRAPGLWRVSLMLEVQP